MTRKLSPKIRAAMNFDLDERPDKGEEPGVLRGVEIDGLAVKGGRGLGCPSAFPSFRVLLLFIHACCH